LQQGRCVQGRLPHPPFDDRQFDQALRLRLFFFYSGQLSARFHMAAIRELGRTAREARIFRCWHWGPQPRAIFSR
jgi:hypothetical protein